MSARDKIRSAAVIATTAAAATAGAIPAAQASQQTPSSPANAPLVTWKNGSTGRYLTVHDGSKSDGAELSTNPTDTQLQQHWYMVRDGTSPLGGLDTYQMKNENSGLCADYLGAQPAGSDVDQSRCTSYTWGERSVLNTHGTFLGWSLTPGGGTVSITGHLCENTTTHNLYIQASFPVHGSNEPKKCLWH